MWQYFGYPLAATSIACLTGAPASAEDFYKGKTIRIVS